MTNKEASFTPPRPGEPMDWVSLYEKVPAESLPWYARELDEDLSQEIARRSLIAGKLLDLGTGPGTQAIALAKLGFEVTGADISGPGIEKAKIRAAGIGSLKFVEDDILATKLTDTFDYIVDRGCFHVFEPRFHDAYLTNVSRLLRHGGLLFLKCFAKGEEMEYGPQCFDRQALTGIFAKSFSVLSIKEARFAANVSAGSLFPQGGHKALFAVMQRRSP